MGDVWRGSVSLAGEEFLEYYRRDLMARSEMNVKTNSKRKRDNRYFIHAIRSNLGKCICGNGFRSYITLSIMIIVGMVQSDKRMITGMANLKKKTYLKNRS